MLLLYRRKEAERGCCPVHFMFYAFLLHTSTPQGLEAVTREAERAVMRKI